MGVFAGDVVALDEVHAPLGIELEDAVIVALGQGMILLDAVHIRVPGADGIGVGHIGAGHVRALDRQAAVRRHAGQTAHDMNAEFEAK